MIEYTIQHRVRVLIAAFTNPDGKRTLTLGEITSEDPTENHRLSDDYDGDLVCYDNEITFEKGAIVARGGDAPAGGSIPLTIIIPQSLIMEIKFEEEDW